MVYLLNVIMTTFPFSPFNRATRGLGVRKDRRERLDPLAQL